MELTKRNVLLHGGQKISILIPVSISDNITTAHDNKGDVLILGNDSRYSFLAECFSVESLACGAYHMSLYIDMQYENGLPHLHSKVMGLRFIIGLLKLANLT